MVDRAGRPGVPRVIAIVDVPTCRARGVDPRSAATAVAEAWAEPGGTSGVEPTRALLVRAKTLPRQELRELAEPIVRYGHAAGLVVLVAADWRLAAELAADGVHLPAAAVADALAARAAGLRVGVSVHTTAELQSALDVGPEYVIAAPVFDPSSKPAAGPPLGLAGLSELCRAAGAVPVLALGGIGPGDVAAAMGAGAWGVAALGPFCDTGAGDAARAYAAAIADRLGATP